ncbi:MAG: hypothetical protein LBF85_06745 [Tannerella sp.]|nr:hypothetical protein [Tannerella sp.]
MMLKPAYIFAGQYLPNRRQAALLTDIHIPASITGRGKFLYINYLKTVCVRGERMMTPTPSDKITPCRQILPKAGILLPSANGAAVQPFDSGRTARFFTRITTVLMLITTVVTRSARGMYVLYPKVITH